MTQETKRFVDACSAFIEHRTKAEHDALIRATDALKQAAEAGAVGRDDLAAASVAASAVGLVGFGVRS